jgi:hypothetical protein
LPEHLQGWPGAYQMNLLSVKPVEKPVAKPDWTMFEVDEKLRDACTERCAAAGDPPCWSLNPEQGLAGGVDVRYPPCVDCLVDAGCETDAPLDPAAVVAPLL